tara:strand:- start:49 stop:606 length:558 start_codon:yes stop_codon:yes gene_type:complete
MASCGDKVNFLSPQPENVDALTEIPNEYHGEFRIDGDTHIVTMSTIDGISIIDDSVVVKKRGSYFYVNRINKKGFYDLVIIRRVNFLNHESISLYVPQFSEPIYYPDSTAIADLKGEEKEEFENLFMKEYYNKLLDHYELFNVVGGLSPFYDPEYTGDIVLENVTVNQLSILTNSSKKYNVERLK